MKRKFSQLLLLVICLSGLALNSCHKVERIAAGHDTDSFFGLSSSTPVILNRIANEIRKQDEQGRFLSRIIKEEGLPQWNHADIIINKDELRNTENKTETKDTSVIIPMVLKDTKYVNSVLICRVSENSITINLIQGRFYHMYGFEEKENTMNADLVTTLLMYYDNKLFKTTEFSISDDRLFKAKTATRRNERLVLPGVTPIVPLPVVMAPKIPLPCISIIFLGTDGTASGILDPECKPIFVTVTDPIIPATGSSGGSSSGSSGGSGAGAVSPTWPDGVCINSKPAAPPPPGYVYPPSCSSLLGVTPKIPVTLYDPAQPFKDLDKPIDIPDGPFLYNGISVDDVPPGAPQDPPRLIGTTDNRKDTEDLTSGYNGDVSGILDEEIRANNNDLFLGMQRLFDRCTFFSNDLNGVGKQMIEKFRTNTSNTNQFTNDTLNKAVEESAAMINFLKNFGNTLQVALAKANGNINSVSKINMGNTRPTFNTFYYKFQGLQILINDTELTEIQLDHFELSPTKTWEADVTVTMYDHFGLDKHDAITYQVYELGFADWWLLQHTRGFVPFVTKVTFQKRIAGVL